MTVSTSTNRADYPGNGATTSFPVPFYFIDPTHLLVLSTVVATGVSTPLVLNSDYTVSGAGVATGGTVTTTVALASGLKLSILLNMPFVQQTRYVPNDPFPAASHEAALDFLTLLVKQTEEQVSRAIQVPPGESGSTVVLPPAAARAGLLLGFDALGVPTASASAASAAIGFTAETQTAGAAQTVFTLTTTTYLPGGSNIAVFIDGLYIPSTDYAQTSSTVVTFSNPKFLGGEQVTFLCGRLVGMAALAANVAFQANGTGSVARNVQDKLREIVSLKDKGAAGDGVADDTVAIQTFFTEIAAGKAGIIPPGVFNFSQPLTLPANFSSLQGSGKYSSVFVYTGASTAVDLITISGTSPTGIKGAATIGGFGIRSNTVMTAGRALLIKWMGHVTTRDIAIGAQYDAQHNLYHGLEYFSTDFQLLEDFEIQVQGEGLRVSGGGAGNAGPQYDLWVDGGKISGCSVGVHIGGGWDNAYFGRGIATFNGTNVLIDNAIQNFKNQEVLFSPQFVTDQPQTGDNYRINDTLANLTNYGQITICGPITGSATGYGINVLNWPSCYLNVLSPYVANNALNGIYIQDASTKLLMSPHTNIVNNGQYGISAAFPNTTVVAPCTFAGNTLGNMNANVVSIHSLYGALAVTKVGSGLQVKEGSNAKQGVATLVAGTIVVNNTSVTATSRIQLTAQDNSSAGALRVSARTAGTSFTITSSNGADAGVVAYEIFEPA